MSALALRIIACVSMLLDHIGFFCNIEPLRWIGRLAFPLYVFLMVNGFRHTKSRLRYALRFACFALVSQLPFHIMHCYSHTNPKYLSAIIWQHPELVFSKLNVMLTLLVGLLVIWGTEALRKHKFIKWFCFVPALAAWLAYYCGGLQSDYGIKGVILALVFYLFDGKKLYERILMSLGTFAAVFYDLLYRYAYCFLKGYWGSFTMPSHWQVVQLFALLSLPLMFLYNGKPGKMPQNRIAKKSIQIGFYAFYPVHMLLLWLIFR